MYLATLEPCTDHILLSTLHLMSAINDTLDLLHDHGFHHHILSLPPRNLTLTHFFRPIYRTLTVVERDAYEELDMRLITRLALPPPSLLLSSTSRPIPALPFIRDAPPPTPLELHLTIPDWAHNPLRLQQLFVFSATIMGIFASTVPSTSVLTADNVPRATPNIVALATTVLFADVSAISHASVQTNNAPSVMTQGMSSVTVLSRRTPVKELSSTKGTLRDCDLVPDIRVFNGGIVMVRGLDLLFSIIHSAPLATDSPLIFTLAISFFTNVH